MAPVCAVMERGRRERKRQRWGTEGTGQNSVHVYTVMPIVYTTMSITVSTSVCRSVCMSVSVCVCLSVCLCLSVSVCLCLCVEMVMDMIVYTMGMTVYTCTVFCPVPSVPHLCLFLSVSLPFPSQHTVAVKASSAVEASRRIGLIT